MNHQATTKFSRTWHPLPAVSRCALLILLLTTATNSSLAESTREKLLKSDPIAQCDVQQKKSPATKRPMPPNPVGMLRPNTEINALEFYARSRDGQWSIPTTVDRNDPWIRVLIMGPTAPVVVDLAVYIEGTPFRDQREQWIDSLLEQANAPPSPKSPDEEETPVPTTTATPEPTTNDTTPTDAIRTVKVRSRQAPTVQQRLRQYLDTGTEAADREEIRWLIAEWANGPGLLALSPAVSWKRAEIAPLWSWLDTNRNHVLSATEIKNASAQLQRADTNKNDVVEAVELQPHESSSPYPQTMSHPLVTILNEQTDWNLLQKQIANLFGEQPERNPESWLHQSADIVARIDLEDANGKISLLQVNDKLSKNNPILSSSKNVITIGCGGTYLELSARASGTSKNNNQIAIGAVVDGYPLFRLLDQDNNRRLTRRECRQLENCLAGLDRNTDGQIAGSEIPTALRLTVTRGLLAHEALKEPTAASKKIPSHNRPTTPSWFNDMDRNQDNDLSRREFLGTSKQFNQLDQDHDGLINAQEAQELSISNE